MRKDINDLLSYIGEIPEEFSNRYKIVQEDFFKNGYVVSIEDWIKLGYVEEEAKELAEASQI